jgi:hypothetical protein
VLADVGDELAQAYLVGVIVAVPALQERLECQQCGGPVGHRVHAARGGHGPSATPMPSMEVPLYSLAAEHAARAQTLAEILRSTSSQSTARP